MNRDLEATRPDPLDLSVYLCLVALTLATAASALIDRGRIVAVTAALSIAAIKAALIAFYYMHLKEEGPLIYAIVLTGITAVLILAFGILPDMAIYR